MKNQCSMQVVLILNPSSINNNEWISNNATMWVHSRELVSSNEPNK